VALECSRLLEQQDVEPVTDPVSELEQLGGEVLAWRDLLRQRMSELPPGIGALVRPELAPLIGLYQSALERAESLLVSMAKLGLAERRVRIEERQHDLMAHVVEEVLRRHGVDPVSDVVRADLYEVTAELVETG
jgi:hypothetical protein